MSNLVDREINPLKILHHFDRLHDLASGRDVAPVTVEIDPVAYCNHACGWCVDPVHTRKRMPWATFEHLIGELAGFQVAGKRVEGIVFKGGGEPSLHPEFPAMVERATALGFSVGVVTNGSRLRRCAQSLAKHAAYVRVSIDGPTPESHERIHGSKDFHQVVQGVGELVAARTKQRAPVIGLSFAMDSDGVALANEAIALGEYLGVDYVLLRPPFFEEVGREPTMTVNQARQVRAELAQLASAYRGPLEVLIGNWVRDAEQGRRRSPTSGGSGRGDIRSITGIPIEHRSGLCLASALLAVVTADGTLYGCCNLRALPAWSMGRLDYGAGTGFTELWNGNQRQTVRARMQRTECIRHCTHPLARCNEIIEILQDPERPHSQFV